MVVKVSLHFPSEAEGPASQAHPSSSAVLSPVSRVLQSQVHPLLWEVPMRSSVLLSPVKMPLPPLLQPPRTERRNETNWSPLGFPGARAGVLELGRGGGCGAGATPGTQLWQLWSGLEQWLPHGAPGWPSPAPRRAQPGSPARSPAWAGAGRSRRAQAPGPQVLGRRRADAGCPPHRRRSTAREEGQSEADPARARQAQWLTSGQAGSDIISAQRRRRAYVPILQMRRLRLREVTLQGSQREEEHGFKPGSLTVALQASLPPGCRVRTCGFLLPPSVTHSVQCPPCLPAPHRPFQAIISPPRMPRLLLTLAAMCSASSSLRAVSKPLQGEGPSPVYLHLSRALQGAGRGMAATHLPELSALHLRASPDLGASEGLPVP